MPLRLGETAREHAHLRIWLVEVFRPPVGVALKGAKLTPSGVKNLPHPQVAANPFTVCTSPEQPIVLKCKTLWHSSKGSGSQVSGCRSHAAVSGPIARRAYVERV